MGGRNMDVATRLKQHRNRPLSAVLEEFEIDDYDDTDGGQGVIGIISNPTNTCDNNHSQDDDNQGQPSGGRVTDLSGSSSNALGSSSSNCDDPGSSCGQKKLTSSGSASKDSSYFSSLFSSSSSTTFSRECSNSFTKISASGTVSGSLSTGSSGSISGLARHLPDLASPVTSTSSPTTTTTPPPVLQVTVGGACPGFPAGGASSSGSPSPTTTPTTPIPTPTSSSSNNSRESSPKPARRGSLRSGRRQALTPSLASGLGLSLSPTPGRRGSGGVGVGAGRFLTSPHSDVTDASDDDTLSPSDMARLRQTADRLHLSTRRPSVMQWRAQYVECPDFSLPWNHEDDSEEKDNDDNGGGGDSGGEGSGRGDGVGAGVGNSGKNRWTSERTERINTALDWIKNELMEMRTQDQMLARQLLSIRSDIHQLKLARSCEEHQDMLDDVQSELEELQEFADVLDLPAHTITDSPLKHLGVTRMNFSARRFSTC